MKRLLLTFGMLMFLLAACGGSDKGTQEQATKAEPELIKTEETTQSTGDKMTANPKVKIETTMGDIVLELEAQSAPATVENFLSYVNEGFYDGTIFHRVIPNFMIQGGGMKEDMSEKATKAPIKNEANNGLKNARGTVAMARTNDPNSASSQFFINVKDNDFLNFTGENMQGWGYAVFGKVVDGMETVDKIETAPTHNHGFHQDVPVDAVIMNKVTVIQ